MTYRSEPLAVASRLVAYRHIRYCDLDSFMAEDGAWRRHHLVLGAMGAHYDWCCKVLLVDQDYRRRDPAFPETLLIRPYTRELVRLFGPEAVFPREAGLLSYEPPTFFGRPYSGEVAVVDLDAAYWQLYAPTSLDLCYRPPLPPRNGNVRFAGTEELFEHKFLRNALIGVLRGAETREAYYGEVRRRQIAAHLQRPELWAFVMDCLQAVAFQLRERFPVLSVATDGYVVPAHEAEEVVAWLDEAWSLSASVRESGHGHVAGPGLVHFGEPPAILPEGQPVDNNRPELVPPHDDELRKWFVEAAAYRIATPEIADRNGALHRW